MLGGVDPLAERLVEALIAVGDVLGGAARPRRCNPPGKRAEHLMAEDVLGRHGARLRQSDTVERGVTDDADLAMLEAVARDQLGRGLRRDGWRQQQKSRDRAADCARNHHPPKRPIPYQPAAFASAMWTLQGSAGGTGKP